MVTKNIVTTPRKLQLPNPLISPPPQDRIDQLNDPRLDGIEEEFRGSYGHGGRTLEAPVKRPAALSRFFELSHCFGEEPNSRTAWVNKRPSAPLNFGRGMGFSALVGTPRIEQYRKRPRRLPHFWFFTCLQTFTTTATRSISGAHWCRVSSR